MEIFKKNWLKSKPFDFELKSYMLKNAVQKINDLISDGKLYTAMSIVEIELHYLYNFKYDRDIIEIETRKITGINIDTLDLEYDYAVPTEEEDKIYEICDISIDELEKLYRSIRDFWRSIEMDCLISEIPDIKIGNTRGFIMYIDKRSDMIDVYAYVEPSNFKMNWSEFKLSHVKSINNDLRSISKFIYACESTSDKERFFRFDMDSNGNSKEECMIPLMKYMLFNRIKHGI